ncbi:zinc dependent phospholipase C family protein [Thalassobacillus sp. CUG 92003]|uniref:zinc dependent phospholipase C family protein n=1 Tax=Thalassobacillus sp. CUG 92003 TaxID=2736641 RepID=UPI0015E668D6|nr:zinc dependent phospholipase C family protein [Thalassobacillus sp. CUG 92003]
MPNVWTHILLCEDVMEGVGATPSYQHETPYFNLGSQGPDPFFYYHFWPFMKSSPVSDLGELLHTENCGSFLIDLIQAGRTASTSAQAYIIGFVTHHFLDRKTHPYIHYRAGYEGSKHQELEVIIDTLLMQRFRNINTWEVPVFTEIDVGPTMENDLFNRIDKRIKTHYPDHASRMPGDYIQASYRDMKRALKIMFDPSGWKNKMIGYYISSFSHQPVTNHHDFLNEREQEWLHSATKEPFTASFLTLFEQARNEAIITVEAIMNYWQDQPHTNLRDIETLIGHISYDTGEPLASNQVNQFSEPIV